MKTLFSLLLLSLTCFAQAGTLTPLGPVNYAGNAPITVNMSWASPTGAAALLFNWTATSSVSVTGISLPATVSASKSLTCTGTFPQQSGTCMIWGMNTTALPAGSITVLVGTPTGTSSITVASSGIQAVDANAVAIASTGASLTIPFVNKCDLNADGVVNVQDVTIAAQRIIASPQITPCNFSGGTGMCTLLDWAVIWKAALGGACQ